MSAVGKSLDSGRIQAMYLLAVNDILGARGCLVLQLSGLALSTASWWKADP